MTRAKLVLLAVAVLAAAALILKATGVVGGPRPVPVAVAPAVPASPAMQARQAEERLLSETAFAHPVDVAAPDVAVVRADGSRLPLASLKGKVVFVNFWATWCPPCIQEMPSMLKLGRELAAANPGAFEMVAVSGDDGWDAVKEYFDKNFGGVPRSLTVTRDPDTSAARAYYCTARGYCPDVKFPETYVVDRRGHIVAMIVGPRDWGDPEARRLLEFLLKG